jgi:hypothetical protein
MSVWRKLLVVVPAFVILHLASLAAVPLIDGLRDLWRPGATDEIVLLGAFPFGYALGVSVGIGLGYGLTRPVLTVSLLVSIASAWGFAEWADSYVQGAAALAVGGAAAGLALPVVARALDLASSLVGGIVMAMLVAAGWGISIPFIQYLQGGLPVGDLPSWAAPYYGQAFFCVVWLPLVVFLGMDRRRR